MTAEVDISAHDRVLVIVPHPDDETIATGGLIQLALACGAAVHVIIASDGDDNPWPQRWLEKRWRIDAAARARWGARRRQEALSALAVLGVSPNQVECLGWPDQGLTEALLHDDTCAAILADRIERFAPSVLVAPALADCHPDHSALHLMVELALARTSHRGCRRLGFLVHARLPAPACATLAFDAERQQRKCTAMAAHRSQLALSATRMQGLCNRPEAFKLETPLASLQAQALHFRLDWPRPLRRWQKRSLQILIQHADGATRFSLSLPWRLHCGSGSLQHVQPDFTLEAQARSAGLSLDIRCERAIHAAWAKLDRPRTRLVVYDDLYWQLPTTSS